MYGECVWNLGIGSPPFNPFTHRHSERFVGNGEPKGLLTTNRLGVSPLFHIYVSTGKVVGNTANTAPASVSAVFPANAFCCKLRGGKPCISPKNFVSLQIKKCEMRQEQNNWYFRWSGVEVW